MADGDSATATFTQPRSDLAGQTDPEPGGLRSSLVQVAPGVDGQVHLHNLGVGPLDVRVDVVGWYLPEQAGGAGLVPVDPGWVWSSAMVGGVGEDVEIAGSPGFVRQWMSSERIFGCR